MGKVYSTHGGKRIAYRFVLGKTERERLLGGRILGLEDNIKRDLREVEWGGMD
jgi:hypothetical protein